MGAGPVPPARRAYSIAMLLGEVLDARGGRFRPAGVSPPIGTGRPSTLPGPGLYLATELAELGERPGWPGLVQSRPTTSSACQQGPCATSACSRCIDHPPLVRMDLLSCRSVLIYFKPAQHQLLRSFHFALNRGGLLLLGKSESVSPDGGGFDVVDPASRFYRCTAPAPVAPPAARGCHQGPAGCTPRAWAQPPQSMVGAAARC